MSWLLSTAFPRRPIVMVEDHLYHIGEALEVLATGAPEILALLHVVCLDRPGPDTHAAVAGWLERYPEVGLAAAAELEAPCFAALEPSVFEHLSELARTVAGMLRPDGLLLQDVQLGTLSFIPRQRWWESIYLASTVRGIFAERPPQCRFLSNKRGYAATFGRDLLEAGFDPRDVLDKGELAAVLVPTVERFLELRLPLDLRLRERGRTLTATAVGDGDRADVEAAVDLALWHLGSATELGGRALALPGGRARLSFKEGSSEGETWRALVDDLFAGGGGLPVVEVGRRVAPAGAGRAELTNCAARHVHHLRSRLVDSAAIRTAEHTYRLDERLRVARIAERRDGPPP